MPGALPALTSTTGTPPRVRTAVTEASCQLGVRLGSRRPIALAGVPDGGDRGARRRVAARREGGGREVGAVDVEQGDVPATGRSASMMRAGIGVPAPAVSARTAVTVRSIGLPGVRPSNS